MKRVTDAIVEERIAVADCSPGDDIDIRHSPGKSWKTIGRCTLVAVKPLPGGGHQIKFRGRSTGATVRKLDLPAGVMADRRRKATADDVARTNGFRAPRPTMTPIPATELPAHAVEILPPEAVTPFDAVPADRQRPRDGYKYGYGTGVRLSDMLSGALAGAAIEAGCTLRRIG